MSTLLVSSIFAIHGIIHLIGFTRGLNHSRGKMFSSKTIFAIPKGKDKLTRALWLIACLLMLVSAGSFYSQEAWFWIPASAGIVISQGLIIHHWKDAKWGTIANMIILTAIVFSVATLQFKRNVGKEVNDLLSAVNDDHNTVTNDMIRDLPPIVQTWLENAGAVGKQIPTFIRVTQEGTLRTKPNGNWMPFTAEQYFTVDPPGFVWIARIHTSMMIDIVGRDKYQNGKGNMLIKAASLIPVANSAGAEVDQGTMIRYMAELAWFPQAAVSDYLQWEQLDKERAKVTMNYAGVTASGIYMFNNEGMPIGFEAQRFGDFKGKYSKETWSVLTTSYRQFDSINIGDTNEVTWKLEHGDFTWLKLTVTDIQFKQHLDAGWDSPF